VARKVTLTHAALKEAIDNIRGAVMICYPMGLPEWDLVRLLLEDKEGDACTQVRRWVHREKQTEHDKML